MSVSISIPRRARRVPLSLLLASLAALAACDDDPTGDDDALCRGNVSVSVSGGTTPTFTWSPACRVSSLQVQTEAGAEVWFIESSGEGIASGVTYGTVPAGAVQDAPATALVNDTSYDVIVFRESGDDVVIAGVANFIP